MSVAVALEELRRELEDRSDAVYLVTVSDDGRPHCVAVSVEWDAGQLVVGSGTTSTRNAATRPLVTLLSPPGSASAGPAAESGAEGRSLHAAYSLIIDGEVIATSPSAGGSRLRLRPTHAVLHRPAVTAEGGRAGDCAHLLDEAAGT